MGQYGLETRFSPSVKTILIRTSVRAGWTQDLAANRTFSSRKETCLSYRSTLRGVWVPDHIADPYAHFMKNGAAVDIARLTKNSTYPETKGKSVTALNKSGVSNKPHVDNGHAFRKTDETLWTSAPRTDYVFNKSSDYISKGGPLFATNAEINLLNRPRSLFKYADSTNPYSFGRISSEQTFNDKYYGQKAISELAPNRPDISASAILGELKEGLPSLIGMSFFKSRTQAARLGKSRNLNAAGQEWLNIQFGLLPLIADIRSVYDALANVTDRLKQYEKDAGKGIRRRMSFPVKNAYESFSDSDLSNQGTVGINIYANPRHDNISGLDALEGTGKSIVTQSLEERIWFSGSFTYFVPLGDDFHSKTDRYVTLGNQLFGLSNSFETLWQLSPWSWLADWLFDIQTTISSYERLQDDNLVLNYGYVMCTSKKMSTQHTTIPASTRTSVKEVMSTYTLKQKYRIRSNPYGFSATAESGLNPRQWSILGALGFTKFF